MDQAMISGNDFSVQMLGQFFDPLQTVTKVLRQLTLGPRTHLRRKPSREPAQVLSFRIYLIDVDLARTGFGGRLQGLIGHRVRSGYTRWFGVPHLRARSNWEQQQSAQKGDC